MREPAEADFFANTRLRQNKYAYRISCRKGLWSVESQNLLTLLAEASRYFLQYWDDGEYEAE